MTPDIGLILGIDGIATGSIYVLVGLGLVLIFSVTRVVFVPFGDIVAIPQRGMFTGNRGIIHGPATRPC